ncbi:MAG: polymer-forming cytoskeletal protein [Cytophagales bacterium]|nr:polymer-forming cytoskeletal protein [Hyphobacterium sp. CCMP332]
MFNNKENKKDLTELRDSSNNIGKGTILEGDIQTFGNIRIEGRLTGNVKSKSKIVLSDSSAVDGSILAQNAEVAGEVKGSVEVSELLILRSSATIHGDIMTNKLVVEAGATFNGSCKMGAIVKEITIGNKEEKDRTEKTA